MFSFVHKLLVKNQIFMRLCRVNYSDGPFTFADLFLVVLRFADYCEVFLRFDQLWRILKFGDYGGMFMIL